MKCSICGDSLRPSFTAKVLARYDAQFDTCDGCGFLKVRHPFWLQEAYSKAIATTDTGIVTRNLQIAHKLAALLHFAIGEPRESRFLDAAGGYGILTRLMRDYGFDFYWADRYCENLLARGFEFTDTSGPCAAVTAFEVMEHLEDPLGFVLALLAQTQADTFIFSTELFEGNPPAPGEWWYYSLETGQHIAFFQKRTLLAMARRSGMRFYSSGGIHLFTRKHLSPVTLKICASRLALPLAILARRRLGSLVTTDHLAMVHCIRSNTAVH